MRKNRSIRFRGKRRVKEVIDLDITSLLDILVIMLVFLLKSYNSSGIILNVPKGISLPKSESTNVSSVGVNVQVSPDTIFVDDQKIVFLEGKTNLRELKDGTIIPLYNELMRKKNLIKQIEKSSPEAKKFSGIVNLIVDKTIRYKFLKKIMHTCARSGFQKYKFVVLGEEL